MEALAGQKLSARKAHSFASHLVNVTEILLIENHEELIKQALENLDDEEYNQD